MSFTNLKKSIESEHKTKAPFKILKSAVGIVFDDAGRVLLGTSTIKDDRFEKFVLCGGGIDKDENIYQAAKREALEESGIKTKALPLAPIIDTDLPNVIFVILLRTGGVIKPNSEFDDMDFFPLNQLPRDIYKQNKKIITTAKNLILGASQDLNNITFTSL